MLATESNSIDHVPIVRHRHNGVNIALCRDSLINSKKALCEYDEVLTRDVVLLDRFSYNDLGCASRV
jgi:hypothetical protein